MQKFKVIWLICLCWCFISWAQEENPDSSKKEGENKELEDELKKKKDPLKEKKKPPIELSIDVGVAPSTHLYRCNTWVPVTIFLTNNSEQDFQGSVRVKVEHQKSVEHYQCPVQIPKKGKSKDATAPKKKFTLPIYLKENAYLLNFELYSNGIRTGYEEFYDIGTLANLNTYRSLLVLSPQSKNMQFFKFLIPHRVRSDLHYANPHKINAKPHSFESYDLIIIDKLLNYDLGESFYNELSRYVSLGGNLLIGTGEQWKSVQGQLTKLGFQSKVTDFGNIFYLAPNGGGPIPLATLEASPQAKSSFVSGVQTPYMVEEKVGLGTISLLATQVNDFKKLSKKMALLRSVKIERHPDFFDPGRNPRAQIKMRGTLEKSLGRDLTTSYKIKLPQKKYIMIYLAAYILCLVPLNFIFFKLIGRLELAWLSICIIALLFFSGITYYQEKSKVGRFVATSLTLTQLSNGSSFAKDYHFVTAHSPSRTNYDLKFGDKTPAYPIGLKVEDSGGRLSQEDFGLYKHWKKQAFYLEETQFWAKAKRNFEVVSFPKFKDTFEADFQLEYRGDNEKEVKKISAILKTPLPFGAGFFVYRTGKNYQVAVTDPQIAIGSVKIEENFSLPLESLEFHEKIKEEIRKVFNQPEDFKEEERGKQIDAVLEQLERENPKCFFFAINFEEQLKIEVNGSYPSIRQWNLLVADLSENCKQQKDSQNLFSATFPEQTIEEGNSTYSMHVRVEKNSFLLLENKSIDRRELSMIIDYFPQQEINSDLQLEFLLQKTDSPFKKPEEPGSSGYRYRGYSRSYGGIYDEKKKKISVEVEIWDPQHSEWRSNPILDWTSPESFFEERKLAKNLSSDLSLYQNGRDQSIRLRYKLKIPSNDAGGYLQDSELPIFNIEAIIRKKE